MIKAEKMYVSLKALVESLDKMVDKTVIFADPLDWYYCGTVTVKDGTISVKMSEDEEKSLEIYGKVMGVTVPYHRFENKVIPECELWELPCFGGRK